MTEHKVEIDRLPWGDSPYDQKSPAEVVYDYAVVRGDLCEQYARDQLAEWIERYAAHCAAESPMPVKVAHYNRYWPDGTYCPAGRTHVSWTRITTTADAALVEATGTEGPITWCGCGVFGFVPSEQVNRPGRTEAGP